MTGVTFRELKEKERALRGGFPENMGLRVHRAISWVGRAQKEKDDPDAAFLFFWIAFNAAYADEQEVEAPVSERGQFGDLLRQIVKLDGQTPTNPTEACGMWDSWVVDWSQSRSRRTSRVSGTRIPNHIVILAEKAPIR